MDKLKTLDYVLMVELPITVFFGNSATDEELNDLVKINPKAKDVLK